MSHASPDRYRFIELFGQVPWFATLPEDARAALASGCRWRRIAGGEALFYEGEASDAVYLLVHGSLAAFQNQRDGTPRLIGQIMAGETVGELGVNDLQLEVLYATWVPKGTPRPVVQYLQKAIADALNRPQVQSQFATLEMFYDGATGADAAKRLADSSARYARVIKKTGMKVD